MAFCKVSFAVKDVVPKSTPFVESAESLTINVASVLFIPIGTADSSPYWARGRTEALAIIDRVYGEFCDDWLKADIDNLEGFVPLNERILSALEKAGMLPPQDDNKSFRMLPSGEMVYNVNEWESEDEEK